MKKRPTFSDRLWAGTEESLQAHIRLEDVVDERIAAGWAPEPVDSPEDEELPYLLSINEGCAIVQIHGPITNNDSWINAYIGRASYPAIREAVTAAALNTDVTRIILDINSGGGSVSGVSDCASLISMVNEQVKPVIAFTDGMMCSAAYWLGCSAGDVFASDVSTVGSIGIITTHMEQSQSLKDSGVKVTVLRAGKFKALANGVEPLTDAAKAQIQESLDGAYKVFVQHVAECLNQPYDFVDANMAQGREFFGQQALAAGLVDSISSFDQLMSNLQTLDAADAGTGQPFQNTPHRIDPMKKKALTSQAIAALASGVVLNAAVIPEDAAAAAAEALAATAVAEAAADEALAATESAAALEAAKVVDATPDALTAYLQAQVKEKDEAISALSIKAANLEAKLSEQAASFPALLEIATKSAGNMQVALGGSALDMSAMTPTLILAEHARVSGVFQTKFKAGGVAAVDAATLTESEPAYDVMYQARLDSVRPTVKK